MSNRLGKQTVFFKQPPSIISSATIVGKKEGEGPLSESFDKIEDDSYVGQSSFEKAESLFLTNTINAALSKASLSSEQIDVVLAGDLLNQCVGTAYGLRDLAIPFIGLYGACSTMAESLMVAAMLVDGGFATTAIAATGSHFCSAERQFRLPLEYGGQRPPSAQWTVTGSGAAIVGEGSPIKITYATIGKIVDMGIKDIANMGAAMAPAFVDTIKTHFEDLQRSPKDYDLILSGDLGHIGRALAVDLLKADGIDISENYNDCGCMIFDKERQDVHSGGSGCGCAASVFCGHILNELRLGNLKRVLFAATGALMSPTTTYQGESIPSISHAVVIENTSA